MAMENQSIEGVSTQYIDGNQRDAKFGKIVDYVGDINRNGREDILIGSPQTTNYRNNAGVAHLISLSLSTCPDCEEICSDEIDNDQNDFVDCLDPKCRGTTFCPISEICNDGVDNDGDGGIDCIDPDCDRNPECPVEMSLELLGEQAYSRAGWSISSAGDVDGDGLDDVLIGAPNRHAHMGNNGKVYLMYASTLLTTEHLSLQFADVYFIGENAGDLAGWSLSSAGDVDNDGLGDILIAAPLNNSNGENSGTVYLFLGASLQNYHAIPIELADYIFIGEHEYAFWEKI